MHIVIGNLPEDATEAGIREALKDFAAVDKIQLVKESGAPTAVIETDMPRTSAETLARRIAGRIYQGKPLTAWVPLRDW
jgi:hypothetical protein